MATTKMDPARSKKKTVNTYGKGTRRRQPKAVFTPLTTSDSMSDEDPINASDAGASPSQRSFASSPHTTSPVSRFKRLSVNRDTQPKPSSAQSIPGTDRKRKISQVYSVKKEPSLAAATQPDAEESPARSPERRRPRATKQDDASTSKPRTKKETRIPSDTQDPMDIDQIALSSPPPTPSPPKVSRASAKPTTYGIKTKTTSAPREASSKKPIPQHRDIPLHLARNSARVDKKSVAQPTSIPGHSWSPVPKTKAPTSRPLAKPRKRLIDALAEQKPADTTDPGGDRPSSPLRPSQSSLSQTSNASELDLPSLPATPNQKARVAPNTATRTFARSSSALKFTYGQRRKVMEEEDNLLDSLALPEESSISIKGRRLELGVPKKAATTTGIFDEDDTAAHDSPNSKLRDIHELRQAGANSRVADAMQDLIDQMGRPGSNMSSRRAALLQVAEKVQDKTFIRQCRDYGVESSMLKDIGQESDSISGYLILSSLITIIAKGSSGHIARLVQEEEAGSLFAQLLRDREDIKKITRDRKSNLSRRSQNAIISIEASLRNLPVWDENCPSFISPRNLAIKCLQLLITQDVLISKNTMVFTEDVTNQLFGVLSEASEDVEYWEYPTTTTSIELCGALSVLDVHAAGLAVTSGNENKWATGYLPIVADAFCAWINTSQDDSTILEHLILKFTINVTNNNLEAAGIFASKGLLPAFTASISTDLNQALASISQESWTEDRMNGVVLRLGILINFVEHSDLVRQIVSDCDRGDRKPFNELVRIFIEHHRQTGEADSMEKTHLNVAFGYLSVLLGYTALYAPARQKIMSSHPARSIGPLIDSIREFKAHYEQVENAMNEANPEAHSHGGYTEQLQDLVQQLRRQAARD